MCVKQDICCTLAYEFVMGEFFVEITLHYYIYNFMFFFHFQIYLHLRFGPDTMVSLLTKIVATIERVRSFSQRLREFLNDVTRSGLQKQYESVCENIGLIAFLLQTEPKHDQC